jgi:membrane fusion protein, copper/silver efflux system
MKKSFLWSVAAFAIIALAGIAYFWQSINHGTEGQGAAESRNGVVQDNSGKEVKYWYDPMVPDKRFDKPGKSPFMDMQLVPKYAVEEGEEEGVSIPAQTVQNLGIRVEPAKRMTFDSALAAVGRVEPDDRAYYSVQTRTPGFVERLLIRAVGDPVKKHQKVAEIYAPELLAAQKEYLALLDIQQVEGINDLHEAARTRLKLLGMSDGEIDRITQTRQAAPRIGIYAPASGIVSELGVREGAQLMAGSTLMQIADLSRVWLIAEVPEQDAARVVPGAVATVELQGRTGEPLKGKVGYIYPTLDETVRALRVRIELPNPKGMLRPGMYANVSFGQAARDALTVPSESVIATGRRKVVIVKDPHGFRPVEVVTGQESGGRTEILQGLAEGEQVVVSGQFLIDSEASLSGVLARLARQETHDMAAMDQPAATKMPKGTGKVTEIDAESSEITLAHGPIPELGWPAMTMGFKVRDARQLQDLRSGDSVSFDLKANAAGDEYLIENILKSSPAEGAHR